MAKVGFTPTSSKSKRHITLGDCREGDIVFLEDDQIFGIVSDSDYNETEITHFSSGVSEWLSSEILCRKFIGEINFNVDDFLEFI